MLNLSPETNELMQKYVQKIENNEEIVFMDKTRTKRIFEGVKFLLKASSFWFGIAMFWYLCFVTHNSPISEKVFVWGLSIFTITVVLVVVVNLLLCCFGAENGIVLSKKGVRDVKVNRNQWLSWDQITSVKVIKDKAFVTIHKNWKAVVIKIDKATCLQLSDKAENFIPFVLLLHNFLNDELLTDLSMLLDDLHISR